jgi:hypothetical protein
VWILGALALGGCGGAVASSGRSTDAGSVNRFSRSLGAVSGGSVGAPHRDPRKLGVAGFPLRLHAGGD